MARFAPHGGRAKPAVGFLFAHGTNAQTVQDTATILTWSHIHFISCGLAIADGETRVRVRKGGGGIYMIYVQAGIERASGTPAETIMYLYKNGVVCDCSAAHGTMAAKEHADITLIKPLLLEEGDYIDIRVLVESGTGIIETDTARITMQEVPMHGYNNGRGGKKMFKGGVMR